MIRRPNLVFAAISAMLESPTEAMFAVDTVRTDTRSNPAIKEKCLTAAEAKRARRRKVRQLKPRAA